MSHLLFRICDTFQITGRGVVIATDVKISEAEAKGVRLKIGDSIELRRPDGSCLAAAIVGVEHLNPYNPERPLAFLLSPQILKDEVPTGAEAWSYS